MSADNDGPPTAESASSPPLPLPLADTHEWLIDGFNLLHAVLLKPEERARGWWNRATRERALDVARRLAEHVGSRAAVIVVFDGDDEREQGGDPAEPRVVFAASADTWIAHRVRASALPAGLSVVTADLPLRSKVAHRGASVVHPRDLVAGLSSSSAAPGEKVE